MRTHRTLAVILLLAGFTSVQPENKAPYQIDVSRYFFADAQAEKAQRATMDAALASLGKLKDHVADSAGHLLSALRLYSQALAEFNKHESYLYLMTSLDTADRAAAAEDSELTSEFGKRTAFLGSELSSITAEQFASFLKVEPGLASYRYAVESQARYRPHTLPHEQEELLQSLSPLTLDWQQDLYSRLLSRTPFGKVHAGGVELDPWKGRAAIAASTDRAAREAGFKKRFEALNTQRDLYAYTLIQLVKSRNRIAQMHGFRNAPEQKYFDSYFTEAEVKRLFEAIAGQAGLYRQYQQAVADAVRKTMGYRDVNIWDLAATPPGKRAPQFSAAEATRTIEQALKPLGPTYEAELNALLDPQNGRIDLVGGANRSSGGFSLGFPGFDSVLFSGAYDDSYNSARILAHESTHAVHRQLMNRGHVLPPYADGPHYLFESFAIFNELLWGDYLYHNERDPAMKIYYLQQLLDAKGMEIFKAAQDASLEQAIYDGVAAGSITSADDLDRVTEQVQSQYSIWFARHNELRSQWIGMRLMYEDPLYLVNYMYAGLLSLEYYRMYTEDPGSFLPKYIALLQHGFDAPPAVLLSRIGINLDDPEMVSRSVSLLKKRVESYAGR